MTGEREEASGIREHSHETTEQSHIRQGIDLAGHAILLIQEPPGRTELDLSCDGAVVEIADHRCDELVIRRIEIIENGARKLVLFIQPVEETGKRTSL